jgi:hypothetical protein
MTAIPHLDIPDILVEDDESQDGITGGAAPRSPIGPSSARSSVDGGQHQSWFGATDLSLHDTAWHHPLSFPRGAPPSTFHHATPSAFSFELQDPDEHEHSTAVDNTEPTTAVSPSQVQGMLDDSVWVESIRRSATVRRSQQTGQYRYGDLE